MARTKPNTIVGQFLPHRVDMLESMAWGELGLAARRVLDRLEIEHMHHGGVENGNLPCTYDDFVRFGVRRKSIAGAIAELVRLGFVEVTHQGRGGNAVYRNASRYRLTYLGTRKAAPTDEWQRLGKHIGADRKNKIPGAKTPLAPGAKTPPTEAITGGENAPTGSVAKTPLLSISREEGQRAAQRAITAEQAARASTGPSEPGELIPISEALARSRLLRAGGGHNHG